MIRVHNLFAAAAAIALLAGAARAATPACSMEMVADFRFEPGGQPIVDAKINGRPVKAILDTGAQASSLSEAATAKLGIRPVAIETRAYGIGGKARSFYATLDAFQLGGGTLRNFRMLISEEQLGEADMLIGRDLLGHAALELDLRHGSMRMLRPKNCQPDQMVYWTRQPYSQAALVANAGDDFRVSARVNGVAAAAILDTGAGISVGSDELARRARIALTPIAGARFRGVGPGALDASVGAVSQIAVGDEVVRNTKIMFAELFRGAGDVHVGSHIQAQFEDEPELLLGDDFLRSHHVLVWPERRLAFFTYEGGPAFAAASVRPAAPATSAAAAAPK